MSVRVSLLGILTLIRVDTLRRVQNVGFLMDRLILCYRETKGDDERTILFSLLFISFPYVFFGCTE